MIDPSNKEAPLAEILQAWKKHLRPEDFIALLKRLANAYIISPHKLFEAYAVVENDIDYNRQCSEILCETVNCIERQLARVSINDDFFQELINGLTSYKQKYNPSNKHFFLKLCQLARLYASDKTVYEVALDLLEKLSGVASIQVLFYLVQCKNKALEENCYEWTLSLSGRELEVFIALAKKDPDNHLLFTYYLLTGKLPLAIAISEPILRNHLIRIFRRIQDKNDLIALYNAQWSIHFEQRLFEKIKSLSLEYFPNLPTHNWQRKFAKRMTPSQVLTSLK